MIAGLDIQALAGLGASIGFGLAGNAKVSITLNLGLAAGTYDPETDTNAGATVTNLTVEAIEFKRVNLQERQQSLRDPAGDKSMDANTKTFLVQAADLPAGTEINQKDTVTQGSAVWGITSAGLDPGRAVWTLEVRRQ